MQRLSLQKDVAEDMTTLLVSEANVSPFEGLVSRPSEPIGAPSLYFFPGMGQHIMSNLMAIAKVSNRVRLVNEAF